MEKKIFFNIKNSKVNWLSRFNTGDWKSMELFSLFSFLCKNPRFLTDWINVIHFFLFCNATILMVGFTAEASHHFKPNNRRLGDGTLQN